MSRIDTKYLIIGNSTAAIAGVEGIRSLDEHGGITLISSEPEHTYSRPLISYFLSEEIDEKNMFYRPADFYEKNRVRALLGSEAIQVDDASKTVFTSNNDQMHFEKLLIATGGAPIVPDIPGAKCDGVFTFLTWKDAAGIRKFVQNRKAHNAVIVGAGLIGVKLMESLLSLNLKVDVVELAGHVLCMILDENAAELAQNKITSQGVNLHCNTTVAQVLTQYDVVNGVRLENGSRLDCDILIFAIGVRPNIAIVKNTGIKTDRGILVDERMQTSAPDIYAAGDVTQGYDFLFGANRPIPIFPNASRQGRIAGVNMAGGNQTFLSGMAMNSVNVFGLPIISVGFIHPPGADCDVLASLDAAKSTYRKIILRDNRIIGLILVNDIDRAGIYTGIIRSKLDVREIRDNLMTNNFGLITLPKEYRKHVVSGMGIEV